MLDLKLSQCLLALLVTPVRFLVRILERQVLKDLLQSIDLIRYRIDDCIHLLVQIRETGDGRGQFRHLVSDCRQIVQLSFEHHAYLLQGLDLDIQVAVIDEQLRLESLKQVLVRLRLEWALPLGRYREAGLG